MTLAWPSPAATPLPPATLFPLKAFAKLPATNLLSALADFETNQLQNLNLRQVYGGGFGYHVIKSDRNDFDVFDGFGGFTYDRDAFGPYTTANPAPPPATIFVPTATQNRGEALVGEEFDSHLSKRSLFTERFSFYPNLTHTGQCRFQFNSNLSIQLKNWLSWQLTFSDYYISYPPIGLLGNDMLLSTDLRVTSGKAKL